MGQDPDAIRAQIEETRGQMGETAQAIGYKADVKERTKESVQEKTDRLKSKITGAGSRLNEATPEGSEVKQTAQRAAGIAQQNPIGLAIGAVAVGFLAGLALPRTRMENERLGPIADDVKERAKETGQEALERGKQVAQDAAQSAAEAAKESGREQSEGLQQSAQESAQEVRTRS
ncbi:MAG TPA: DUF3618 domain-containing protein [Thermoleophilaceae bacterium]